MNQSDCVKNYWNQISFFPCRYEVIASTYWPTVILIPYLIMVVWGLWTNRRIDYPAATAIIGDPYIMSLGVALLLSGIAFSNWQATIRHSFSTALEAGIIGASPEDIDNFLSLSRKFESLMASRWRYLPIGASIVFTLTANAVEFPIIYQRFISGWSVAIFRLLTVISFLLFSYCVGAVAWCLFANARWMTLLSRSDLLRIQPGHSDGCCGLERIGNCCLQSAIPLLVGMVLCLVWTNSRHIALFREYNTRWIDIIIPYSYVMMIVLFLLACVLVFLPLLDLHKKMSRYKTERDVKYASAVEAELSLIETTLINNDVEQIKHHADRIKLVQVLDPSTLRLSTWPFDRASLLKYGVTPFISLTTSFGKEIVKALFF